MNPLARHCTLVRALCQASRSHPIQLSTRDTERASRNYTLYLGEHVPWMHSAPVVPTMAINHMYLTLFVTMILLFHSSSVPSSHCTSAVKARRVTPFSTPYRVCTVPDRPTIPSPYTENQRLLRAFRSAPQYENAAVPSLVL
jgi:hypothetical protein